jgi:hypothetical protein
MKVWEQFMTRQDFEPTMAAKRNCTKDCHLCQTELTKSGTKYVHMIQTDQGKTKYICDWCKDVLKAKVNE